MPKLKRPNRMGFKFNPSGGFESTNFLVRRQGFSP